MSGKTEYKLIVTKVIFGLVLYDNFEDVVYFGWENKTPEQQAEILRSREPKTYFDAFGKMSEEYYRKIYDLSDTEFIPPGTIKTMVIKPKPSERVGIFDSTKNKENIVQ